MMRARWLLLFALVWCTACAASLRFDIAEPRPAPASSVAYATPAAAPSSSAPATPHHRLGASVPIPSPSTAGIALVSKGPGVNPGWTALNLGQAGAVTGTLPTGNLPNLAGDVTGAPGANTVGNLSGSAGTVTASATTLSFDAASTVGIGGTGPNSGTAASLSLSGQNPGATNGTPGGVTVDLAAPTGSGSEAAFSVYRGATSIGRVQYIFNSASGALWLLPGSSSSNSYSLRSGAGITVMNTTGIGYFRVNDAAAMGIYTASGLQLFSETAAFGGGTGVLGIANATTNPSSWPGASSGIDLFAESGMLGVDAAQIQFSSFIATPTISQDQVGGTGTNGGDALSIVAQQGQNVASGTNNNGGNLYLSSGQAGTGGSGGNTGSILFALGRTTEMDLAIGATPALISFSDLGLNLGASSNRWNALYVQNVTVTSSGVGGNAGAGTAANAAYKYQSTTLSLSSGTVTLTAAQASTPLIALSGNTTAAETIVFPNVAAEWFLDTSQAGSSQSGNLTLECGTGATTRTITQSSGSYPIGVYVVWCDGANKLYDSIMAN